MIPARTLSIGRVTPMRPVEPTSTPGLPAGVLSAGKREVLVGTATTAVRLGQLTAPGRRPMPAVDWARGVRPEAGVVLE